MLGVESVWTVSGSFYCVKFKCVKLLMIQTEFVVLQKGQFPPISLKKQQQQQQGKNILA